MIVLVFLSWGCWTSTASGHPFIFIFVAGALGLRGNRFAAIAYMALCFLMPRPVQLPLALWLLWKLPDIRWPAAVIFAAHAVIVVASGYALEWANTLVALGAEGLPVGNYGPSALIGSSWLLIGLPLGALLTWRGHVGLAGLAASPYWLPEYLMMALLDLVPGWKRGHAERGTSASPDPVRPKWRSGPAEVP